MKPTALVVSLLALAAASPALAQAHPEERDNLAILTHIHEPTPRAPLPGDTAALRVPEGFTVSRFAEHLGNLRMLAVAPNGDIYAVTPRADWRATALQRRFLNILAEQARLIAANP